MPGLFVRQARELKERKAGVGPVAKNQRKVRDGSGPYRDSYQRKKYGRGRRRRAGEGCPYRVKKSK